jgi:hypothetical protein
MPGPNPRPAASHPCSVRRPQAEPLCPPVGGYSREEPWLPTYEADEVHGVEGPPHEVEQFVGLLALFEQPLHTHVPEQNLQHDGHTGRHRRGQPGASAVLHAQPGTRRYAAIAALRCLRRQTSKCGCCRQPATGPRAPLAAPRSLTGMPLRSTSRRHPSPSNERSQPTAPPRRTFPSAAMVAKKLHSLAPSPRRVTLPRWLSSTPGSHCRSVTTCAHTHTNTQHAHTYTREPREAETECLAVPAQLGRRGLCDARRAQLSSTKAAPLSLIPPRHMRAEHSRQRHHHITIQASNTAINLIHTNLVVPKGRVGHVAVLDQRDLRIAIRRVPAAALQPAAARHPAAHPGRGGRRELAWRAGVTQCDAGRVSSKGERAAGLAVTQPRIQRPHEPSTASDDLGQRRDARAAPHNHSSHDRHTESAGVEALVRRTWLASRAGRGRALAAARSPPHSICLSGQVPHDHLAVVAAAWGQQAT